MAPTTAGTALAERPSTFWPSPSAALMQPVGSDTLPAIRPVADPYRVSHLPEGVLSGLLGAVTGLAVSRDGAHLVAAHYGDDAVSLIATGTLAVTATVPGIAEPYAVAAADRAYVRSGSISEDSVVAVDLESGAALADRKVGLGAGALAVSPSGEVLYVARSVDGIADIAAVDIESGGIHAIPVTRDAGASIDTVRINSGGRRLYAALTTAAVGALVVVNIPTGQVKAIPVGAAVGEIAVPGDDRRVFVTGWDAAQGAVLHMIDAAAARVVRSTAVEGPPVGVLATGAAVYLAHGEHVTVLDAGSLRTVNRVRIGRPVSCLAISCDGTRLYIGDYDGAVAALAVPDLTPGVRAA